MRGKPSPLVRRIRIALAAGMKPKEIVEKYGCKIGTVYDTSYRMRREAREHKEELNQRTKNVLAKEVEQIQTSSPAPRFISYRQHLEVELENVRKQIEVLQGVATFLKLRVIELDASSQ